jgi:archaellum component FlaC
MMDAEAPPMTQEQAAIMAHDEELFRIKQRVDVLEAAVKTLARDIATLMKDRNP